MRRIAFALSVVFLLINTQEGNARRAIPDDNLAYPVLVILNKGGSGSGFFINTGTEIYLVTAKHILFEKKTNKLKSSKAKLLSYSKDPTETGRNVFEVDLLTQLKTQGIHQHPTEDVSIVFFADNLGEGKLRMASGVSVKEKTSSGILCVASSSVKFFDDILTANTIYLFGYPTSLGIKEMPQIDSFRPLLRYGIIAGTNPRQKKIILDCPSYPGNSGGPVLEVEETVSGNRKFRVIGVVIQFIPFVETWKNETHGYQNLTISNSGYAVAVPMDPVIELIDMK